MLKAKHLQHCCEQTSWNIQCVAVKAPGFGDRRKAMLEDIATLNWW